jgi:hypothetical protein
MSTTVHDQMGQECGNSVGFGIALPRVVELFDAYAQAMKNKDVTLPIASTKIAFTIKTKKVTPPKIDVTKAFLTFADVEIDVILHEQDDPAQIFTTLEFTFAEIRGEPYLDKAARLRLRGNNDPLVTVNPVGQPADELLKRHFTSPTEAERLQEYKLFEFMFRFNSLNSIPELFVNGIQFPDVISGMGAIRLAAPVELAFTEDFLVLKSGHVTIAPPSADCPKVGDANDELTVAPPTITAPSVATASASPTPGENHHVTSTIVHREDQPPSPDDFEDSHSPIVLYLPEIKLLDFSSGALKPSLSAHDGGSFIAYWEYFATIALEHFGLTLVPSKLAIQVDADFSVFGSASAGIQILCVRIEVAGVQIKGTVRDVSVLLFPVLENGRVVLYSKQVKPVNVDLDVSGSFPIGMVIAPIVDSIMTSLVRQKIANILNSLRVPLLDLRRLGIDPAKVKHTLQSVRADSVLIGFE